MTVMSHAEPIPEKAVIRGVELEDCRCLRFQFGQTDIEYCGHYSSCDEEARFQK
jgi:hypothetical protein